MPRQYPLARITREDLEPIWLHTKLTTDEIGAKLGVTGSAIRWRARQFGLPKRGYGVKSYGSDAEFRRMWKANVAVQDMADHFGYRRHTSICARARRLGLAPRHRVKGAARRTGTGRNGWVGTVTMREWQEAEIGRRMAQSVERRA